MNICGDYHYLDAMRIIKSVIIILKIVIPIILIVLGSIDFFKTVLDPDKNTTTQTIKTFAIRLVSAIMIFLLPSLLSIIFNFFDDYSYKLVVLNNIMESANKEYIDVIKNCNKNVLNEQNKPKTYTSNYNASKNQQSNNSSDKISGDFLEISQNIWKQLESNNYSYKLVAHAIPPTSNSIDCSSFVTWILYEYGYKDDFNIHRNTTYFVNSNFADKYGWEEINVAKNENVIDKLQPGDILVRDSGGGANGHINITVSVENGRVYAYDAGAESHWQNSGGQPYDATSFAEGKTGNGKLAGKIIRVKSNS